ncbi:hypothetical protein ACFFRR_000258 [Megaselia abdita]
MLRRISVLICVFVLINKLNCSSISNTLFQKYCKNQANLDSITCSNFNFTLEEIREIQTEDFSLSNALRVTFENASIGCLNSNFFLKFPNAVDFIIKYSTFNMSCEYPELPSKQPLPLNNLRFYYALIFGNKDSSALNSLEKLERFEMQLPKVTGWLQYPFLDDKFFEKNYELRYISFPFEELDEDLDEDFLKDGAFDNVPNLYKLTYNFGKQESITKRLFSKNNKLCSLDLSRNGIKDVEPGSLPETLLELYLSGNFITQCDYFFKNMTKLGYVNLYGNSITNISTDAFDDMESLEILDLSKNDITTFSKDHIKGLKSIKSLFIYDNNHLMFDKEISTMIPNFKTQL